MKLGERLRARLAGALPAWGEACPAGEPVPTIDHCAAAACGTVHLTALRPGERATVSCLEEPGSTASCKLAGMGVLPGVEVMLVQRYPAFVFRVGFAELAVDHDLAGHIRVRRQALPTA
ncbi:MAG: FeoA family protein [Gemmatimonadota bacterium]